MKCQILPYEVIAEGDDLSANLARMRLFHVRVNGVGFDLVAIAGTAIASQAPPCRPENFRRRPAWRKTLPGLPANYWNSLLLA